MRRRLACAAAIAASALAGCGGDDGPQAQPEPAPDPVPETAPTPAPEPALEPAPVAPAPAPRPADALARVEGDAAVRPRRRLPLRIAPGARVAARVGPRTEFGSARWMAVARRRGDWVAVIAPERPNGRVGWLPLRHLAVRHVSVRLAVDLSERRLVVRRAGRTVLRMTVAIGAPATPTPTGRFAVTDGLSAAPGSPYGCCILALSGHQPNIPQGWTGGDRLAVHGTSAPETIGTAASNGCLRASDPDMRRLMAAAQLGSIVTIRA